MTTLINKITKSRIILKPNFKILSNEDKSDLKARIASSLAKKNQRIKRKRIVVLSCCVASLIVICLILLLLFNRI